MVIRWTMDYGYGQWASGRSVRMLCPIRAVVVVVVFYFFFGFGLLFSFFFYFFFLFVWLLLFVLLTVVSWFVFLRFSLLWLLCLSFVAFVACRCRFHCHSFNFYCAHVLMFCFLIPTNYVNAIHDWYLYVDYLVLLMHSTWWSYEHIDVAHRFIARSLARKKNSMWIEENHAWQMFCMIDGGLSSWYGVDFDFTICIDNIDLNDVEWKTCK